uniref:Uncharacterized protein n=1 Tax=Globodera rostochiensis TaxID=31243 RepID=A0A914H4W4_GLORO
MAFVFILMLSAMLEAQNKNDTFYDLICGNKSAVRYPCIFISPCAEMPASTCQHRPLPSTPRNGTGEEEEKLQEFTIAWLRQQPYINWRIGRKRALKQPNRYAQQRYLVAEAAAAPTIDDDDDDDYMFENGKMQFFFIQFFVLLILAVALCSGGNCFGKKDPKRSNSGGGHRPSTSGGTSGGASSGYKQSGSTNEGTKLQKRMLEPHGRAPSYKQFDSKKSLEWIPEGYR